MNKISVAMTAYNGEKFLKEQLDSIIKQSRQVDQLVVCDDGSKDGTVGLINEFSLTAPFPVKVVINEKNLGSTKNFEKAISLCEGDIIILCDQDDVWLYDKVKILEDVFLANPQCLMAFTDAMVVDEMNNPLYKLWPVFNFNKKEQTLLKKGDGLKIFIGNNVVTGATAAIKKSLFEKAYPFPAKLVHDYWMAAISVLDGSLFFSDAVTINYRSHSAQQLGTGTSENIGFFQKINQSFINNNIIMNLAQITLKEFNYRFHLTQEQHKLFTDKIEFYLFRCNLPSARLMRIPGIIKNLFLGNYYKFASGFLSIFKDLLFTNDKCTDQSLAKRRICE